MILHVLSFVDTYNPVTDCIYSVLRHKERMLWPPSRAPHRVVTHILLSTGVKPHHLDLQFVSNLPHQLQICTGSLPSFYISFTSIWDVLMTLCFSFIYSFYQHLTHYLEYEMMQLFKPSYCVNITACLLELHWSLYVRDLKVCDCLKFVFML